MPHNRQIDDNQDDLGRSVNNPRDRIGDRATLDKAQEIARSVGVPRPPRHKADAPDVNQKSKPH
ncbi:hypothetical protein PRN20_17635 [Devosia sp. ZB163]|uniref:hypothetical protein n=1 Tax=Devosia sp. ZB163 TaxID=3025938 RepID=UPI00235F5317|nr:hypothetical protein [Devosia sp. ZB163]MDC9825558.1 hypothetical protein [Devosia sp. ZB163]